MLVEKGKLLPDDKSVDWREHVQFKKEELRRNGVNIKQPTAFDTFKFIGQVKAKIEDVEILDFYPC